MKGNINKKELRLALAQAKEIISGKKELPILKYVAFECSKDGVLITATNLTATFEKYIDGNFDCSKDDAFGVSVELQSFINAVNLSKENVAISYENDVLQVNSVTVITQSISDYPDYESIEGSIFTLSYKELKKSFELVLSCCSSENSRYILTCVNIAKDSDKLILQATDGKRLIKTELTVEESLSSNFVANIPCFCIRKALKILSKEKGLECVRVVLSSKGIELNCVGGCYTIKGCNVVYPDVDRVIPIEKGKCFHIDTKELLTIVKTLAKDFTLQYKAKNNKLPSIQKLIFDIENGILSISHDFSTNAIKTFVTCEFKERITFALDGVFLEQLLKVCEEKVLVSFTENYNPLKLQINETTVGIIMQIRMNS
jgi:DNA polymerase III sliding clamp (beta) subunit (PCNA family)